MQARYTLRGGGAEGVADVGRGLERRREAAGGGRGCGAQRRYAREREGEEGRGRGCARDLGRVSGGVGLAGEALSVAGDERGQEAGGGARYEVGSARGR